jgi:chaperonin GroES
MTMKDRPLHDRVLVRREEEEEKTAGGILLTGTAKEKSNKGVVVAVGPGRVLDNGQVVPVSVKAGDRVRFASYAGSQSFKEGKDELIFISDSEIYSVIGK